VTYNSINTYEWFKEKIVSVDTVEGYDPSNREQALQFVMQHEGLVTGLIYQDKERKPYDQMIAHLSPTPLAHADLKLPKK
jgi:2-oxoglutarate ferredoxin oxidoreductase subunit beta